MASNRIKPGNRVKVSEGVEDEIHGPIGGKVGTVQSRLSQRPGKTVFGEACFAIKDDKGNVFTATLNQLTNL